MVLLAGWHLSASIGAVLVPVPGLEGREWPSLMEPVLQAALAWAAPPHLLGLVAWPPCRAPNLHPLPPFSPHPPRPARPGSCGLGSPNPSPHPASLVLQHDIWPPHHGGRHPQHPQAFVVLRVPAKAIVAPLLQGEEGLPGLLSVCPTSLQEQEPSPGAQKRQEERRAALRASGPRGVGPERGKRVRGNLLPSLSRRWW